MWPIRLYSIFPLDLINGTMFGRKDGHTRRSCQSLIEILQIRLKQMYLNIGFYKKSGQLADKNSLSIGHSIISTFLPTLLT